MSLEEQIKLEEEQLKKELEGTEDGTNDAENTDDVNDAEEGNDDDANEEGADEKTKEDDGNDDDSTGEEDKDEEEKTKGDDEDDQGDNSLQAQLRIARKHNKDMEKRLDALLAKQQPEQPKQPEKATETPQEAQKTAPTAEERLDRMEQEKEQKQLMSAAVDEFNQYEREYTATNPDYENASKHVVSGMVNSFRNLYPSATDAQAQQFIQNQILTLASQAVNRGVNPAEALYALAHDRFGYTPGNKTQPKGEDATKRLSTVNKNKRRSASPLQSGGQNGSASATIEEATNMDLGDFSKLTDAEIDQMIGDLQ